jgi:trimeric autotransporter adhesin
MQDAAIACHPVVKRERSGTRPKGEAFIRSGLVEPECNAGTHVGLRNAQVNTRATKSHSVIHIDPSIYLHLRSLKTTRPPLIGSVGRAWRSLLPVAVICFLLPFAYSPARGQSPVALQGTVSDRSTGSPIAGVQVLLFGSLVTTSDANGNYSVSAQQLNNNATGALTFQGAGYYLAVRNYTITTSPTTLDATLLPGGTIVTGVVTDSATQAAIVGAFVLVCPSTSLTWGPSCVNATTNSAGQYMVDSSQFIEAASNGFDVQSVSASAAGYFNYSSTTAFHVASPFPVTHNLAMSSNGVLRRVTIATDPPGLGIVVDGVALFSPQSFDWVPSNQHTLAANLQPTGMAGIQYAFSRWSDNGAASHVIVVPDADTTYTASFKTQFALTTSVNPTAGGSVTAGGWFDAGSAVTITATPVAEYQFTGFTGALTGLANPQTLVIDGPKSTVANFSSVKTSTTTNLTSTVNPAFVGQSITFTATVTGSTPTGSITLNDGATLLASVPLIGSQASYTTSSLAIGSHPIVATYSGDAANTGSMSTTLSQVVNAYMPVTLTVASLADDNGPGTLRYQIANAHSGDTITFSASGTIVLAQGQLEISNDVIISGSGAASLTISGNNMSRVFQIDSGTTVSITGVTVEQGAGGINGRDILNNGTLAVSNCRFLVNTYNSNNGEGNGGGLYNAGTATVTNCSFVGSVDFGVAGDGGGIYNAGNLTVVGSTFSNFGVGGYGSAIFNAGYFQSAAGTGTVFNSTFWQNRANEGAAIFDAGTATSITAVNSTFSGNAGNSVVYTLYGGTTLKNALIANSGGNNCGGANGPFKSGGYNLSDDNSCSAYFTQTGDMNNTPAGLDPNGLKDNGGPTPTVGLLPSSPALDAIPLSACTDTSGQMITADQRGIARPQGTACDIGAFDRAPGVSTTVSMSSFANPSAVNQSVTFTVTVTPVSGTDTPTGSVVFIDGSTTLATLPLSGSAQATYATSSLAVGTHNITVSYSGDVQFNGSTSTTYSQVVNFLSTAITIAAPTVPHGSTANVSVSVSSGQDTVTGNVSLTVDSGSPLTQALSNGSTIFNISGLAVGSHSLSASYAAQGNFDASSSTGTLQVNQAQPTISIGNIPTSAAYSGNFTPTYSYIGDGATSVTSSTTGTCAVSGAVVNFVGAGTCTLIAHATAGTNYSAATGNPQSFSIAKVTTTISINNIPSAAKYGGSFAPAYAYVGDGTPSVTSSTIATCTVSGNVVNFVGAGLCTLTAHATAGNNYLAANGNPQSFTIAQATPTISINNIPTSAKDGGNFAPTYAYIGDGATSVTSNTSGTCTVSGSVVNFVAVGTCTLTAHAAATANSAAATGSPQSFSIGQATPTINISNLPGNAAYGGLFTPTYAYAGNGKTSTTSNTLSTCTVSGMGVVNFVGTGTCTLIAHAAATVNYAAATGSPQSFTIAQATTTISIKNIPNNAKRGVSFTPTYNYIGDGTPSTTSSTPATCTVFASLVNFLSSGTCRLTAQATAGSHYAATTGSPQSFTVK